MMTSFAAIKQEVAAEFHLEAWQLGSTDRRRPVAHARQMLMYLGRTLGGFSLQQMGNWLGRDHSTVAHGVAAVEERLAASETLRDRVVRITARLPQFPHYPQLADTWQEPMVNSGAGQRANATRPLILNPPAEEVSQTMADVYRGPAAAQALSVAA